MYTIDSSVWVNGFDRREPGHATSRQLLDLIAVGLFTFIRVQEHLEALLGCRVDLITPEAIRPIMRDRMLAEATRAI